VSSDPEASRILIVEDDPVVSDTMRLYLDRAGFEIVTAADGREGLARALQSDIALVVLDWMLPGISGYDVCRRLRAHSAVPILMVTARASDDDRVRALEAGADDYVPKPFSPREVVARVRALLRRVGDRPGTTPAPTRIGNLEVDHFRREARMGGMPVALTPTEFRLLETLARHPGRTFTRDELVDRVFGPDYEGLDRIVDTHVTHLRRKLERYGARHVATVHGLGYRLHADGDG